MNAALDSEVVDANIAHTKDVPELWRWAPLSWVVFEWVVWVRLADGRIGWVLVSDQILQRSLGEQWALEIAWEDAIEAAMRS